MSDAEQSLGQTRPLDENSLALQSKQQKPEKVTLVSTAIPNPWSVRLLATDHAIPIQLKIDDRAIIGRADPDANYLPEIDLAPYDALDRGVSRRHAELRAGQDYLVIMDRNSTNGTQLNGIALKPREYYRLRHGDRLTVGTMELEVFVSMMPVHRGTKRLNNTILRITRAGHTDKEHENRRVLIVENDDATAKTLEQMISELGYDVQVVTSTGAAMRSVANDLPDCVIIELDMPDHPVAEICRMIKEDRSNLHVPVFVISSTPNEVQIREAFDAGADVYWSKPLGVDELVNGMQSYVGDPVIRR